MKKIISLAILMFISLSLGASCMKKPDLADSDGPPVAPEAVQDALLKAWGNSNANDIQQNEFSYVEKEIGISEMPVQVVLQDSKTVAQITDPSTDPTLRVIRILHQIREFTSDNQSKLSSREDELKIKKPGASSLDALNSFKNQIEATATDAFLPYPEDLMIEALSLCVMNGEGFKSTCHNLKAWETVEEPPPLVRQRPGCEGLRNCQLRKKVISYDWIVEYTDAETNTKVRQKLIYTIKISPDVPHLSRVTDYCYQGLGSHQGQKFPATFCQTVKNFIRGNP